MSTQVDENFTVPITSMINLTLTVSDIQGYMANGKNCAVFHTSAKFSVQIPAIIIYITFRYSANEYSQY